MTAAVRAMMRTSSASALVLALALCGCAAATVSTRLIEFRAADDANRDSPVAVWFVLVRDPGLVEGLQQLTARDWARGREQWLRDHPGMLVDHQWELVPGQSLEPTQLPFRDRTGVALFVFADYLAAGAHRVRVDPLARIRIELGVDGFSVEPIR